MLRQWRRYNLLLRSNQPKQVHSPDRVLYQWYHVDSQIPPLLGDMFKDLFSWFTPIWERFHKIPIFPTDCFKDCFCSIIKNGYVLWLSKKVLDSRPKKSHRCPWGCLWVPQFNQRYCLVGKFWSNYSDLRRPISPKWWWIVRATPL